MDQQQLNHNPLSPAHQLSNTSSRGFERTHRGNGYFASEFLSDDDNSEKNINNSIYNPAQSGAVSQRAQINNSLQAFQEKIHQSDHQIQVIYSHYMNSNQMSLQNI